MDPRGGPSGLRGRLFCVRPYHRTGTEDLALKMFEYHDDVEKALGSSHREELYRSSTKCITVGRLLIAFLSIAAICIVFKAITRDPSWYLAGDLLLFVALLWVLMMTSDFVAYHRWRRHRIRRIQAKFDG